MIKNLKPRRTFFKDFTSKIGSGNLTLLAFGTGLCLVAVLSTGKASIEKRQASTIIKETSKEESKNIFKIDLSNMEMQRTELRTIKDKDGNIVGSRFWVYWRKTDDNAKTSYFLTIKEPIKNLKHNKKAYESFLVREAKNKILNEIEEKMDK